MYVGKRSNIFWMMSGVAPKISCSSITDSTLYFPWDEGNIKGDVEIMCFRIVLEGF